LRRIVALRAQQQVFPHNFARRQFHAQRVSHETRNAGSAATSGVGAQAFITVRCRGEQRQIFARTGAAVQHALPGQLVERRAI